MQYKKICKNCGKEFIGKRWNIAYCSSKCKKENRSPKKEKTCIFCNKKFIANKADRLYCSSVCKKKSYSLNRPSRKRTELIVKKCLICKKIITAKTDNILYCKECAKLKNKLDIKKFIKNNKEKHKEQKLKYSRKREIRKKESKKYLNTNRKTKLKSIGAGKYKTRYTLKEDLFILDNWKKITIKEIAVELKRSFAGIQSRLLKIK